MKLPKQCAILVGGLGTRLGALTAHTPKPLLTCGDRPYLAWVLRELSRFGIEDVILLAGYKSAVVEEFCRTAEKWLPRNMHIEISVEPERADTAGALWYARDKLADSFMVINGDSWLDTNFARFFAFAASEEATGCMLLRRMEDCARYGKVECVDGRVRQFTEKRPDAGAGLINGGIYIFDRAVLDEIPSAPCSMEKAVLPSLAAKGKLCGMEADGYFIDIGVPADYERAQTELPARLKRPALFLDRDGVLNKDTGWVGKIEDFHWIDGAKDAVRRASDAGYHVFIVTNQAGVARGFYGEADVAILQNYIREELLKAGAVLDDYRYCPYHPEAQLAAYRKPSDWRKPNPGMLLDLARAWEVDMAHSLLIGDKPSDIAAAENAGIPGQLFSGGNLDAFVQGCLPARKIL